MRALLLLALLAPTALAHADPDDHGEAYVSAEAGGAATRLVPGCDVHVQGTVSGGWTEGRLLLLRLTEDGGVRLANESSWRAGADGDIESAAIYADPGVYLAGVELDAAHGIYSEAFRVDCAEAVCPTGGCETYRVTSTARAAPPRELALLAALAGIALAGALVVWRG